MRCASRPITGQIEQAAASARLGIPGSEHDAGRARLQERADAHGAWLECHIQCGRREAVIVLSGGRGAQRHDLCMRSWITAGNGSVPSFADGFIADDHQRTDRHLTLPRGTMRQFERSPHVFNVGRHVRSLLAGARFETQTRSCTAPKTRQH